MSKRIVASALWLFSIAWGWNYVAAITGTSDLIGLALGAGVALFVGVDPRGLFFARPEPAVSRPAPTLAQGLR